MNRVHQSAARHRQAVELLQERHDLAERQTQLLVEDDDQRDHLRTQLRGGRANRVGGLQRMSALHAAATSVTAAHMNVELADHDARDWQFFLILGGDARANHRAGTRRTACRERDIVLLVNAHGTPPARLRSIRAAGFPPWSLGILFQGFGEGRRLPEPRPPRVVELSFEMIDLLAEALVLSAQSIALALGLLGTLAPIGIIRSAIRIVRLRRLRHAAVMPEFIAEYKTR
jgi:hypothetical protein